MTYWILLALASMLTFFYFRQKWNVLFAIITAFSWVGILVFTLTNPPTDIAQGTLLHDILLLVYAGMAITMLIMWFRNKGNIVDDRGNSEMTPEETERRNANYQSPMSMSETQYKAYLRGLRTRRR